MADRSEQERARQEEESTAGGPVSRGASNKSDQGQPDQQFTSQHTTGSTGPNPDSPDYNKLMPQSPTGTTEGDSMTTKRNLGTVGGGTIPNSGTSRGGMSTSNSTVGGGGTSAGGVAGAGSTPDRGTMTNVDTHTSTNQEQILNQQSRGNIGGRNPNQPQTSMGNRDTKRSASKKGQDQTRQGDTTHGGRGAGTNEETTDPMTSRAPDKVKPRTDNP